jgi:hypothetical protein
VRSEGGLEGVGRVEIEVPHRDIGRRHPWRAAGDAFFNRHALAGRTELLLHHRHVPLQIVGYVELAACRIGIEHAYLDHVSLPDPVGFQFIALVHRVTRPAEPQRR